MNSDLTAPGIVGSYYQTGSELSPESKRKVTKYGQLVDEEEPIPIKKVHAL